MKKCRHVSSGYMRTEPYVRADHWVVDATGVIHLDLVARCDKCGEKYMLCKVHVNSMIETLMRHDVTKETINNVVKTCNMKN